MREGIAMTEGWREIEERESRLSNT